MKEEVVSEKEGYIIGG